MAAAADTTLAQSVALARRVEAFAAERGRDDLVGALRDALRQAPQGSLTAIVCGEAGRGKTALLNALLDAPGLLPVSAEASTAVHVAVRHPRGDEAPGARVHGIDGGVRQVAADELGDWILEPAPAERGVRFVEVLHEHPLLADGLVLLDTPGIGGLHRAHGQAALHALSVADVALCVLDARAPVGRAELEFFTSAADRVVDVVAALNRSFEVAGWREIQAEDEALLARVDGLRGVAVVPVSASLKRRADRLEDADRAELAGESGVPALQDRLGGWLQHRAGALHAARICRASSQVVERLRAGAEGIVASGEESPEELHARARGRREVRERLAAELPALRRQLQDARGVMQREIDADLAARLGERRRELERQVADGETGMLDADVESALLAASDDALRGLTERLAELAGGIAGRLAEYDVALEPEGPGGVPVEPRSYELLDVSTSTPRAAEWLAGRSPLMAGAASGVAATLVAGTGGAVVLIYPVAVAAALLFEWRRTGRRTERERMVRQIGETFNQARGELGVPVMQALVQGHTALAEEVERAVRRRIAAMDEELEALSSQISKGAAERSRRAADARELAAKLDELAGRVGETRRAALQSLRRPVAR